MVYNKEAESEVVAREGSPAELPCDLGRHPLRRAAWIRKESPERPIYAVRLVSGRATQANRSSQPDWGSRAYFSLVERPAKLKVTRVRASDEGTYYCVLETTSGVRDMQTVHLKVVEPPGDPRMEARGSVGSGGPSGPFNEGEPLLLACEVSGGRPTPHLQWNRDGRTLPTNETQPRRGVVRSTVLLVPRRGDLGARLTCMASNNVSGPGEVGLTLDLNLRPESVRIQGRRTPLAEGLPAELHCEVRGSRPRPWVSWTKGGRAVNGSFEHVSADGALLTSVMSFVPERADHEAQVTCSASNPKLPNAAPIRDSWILQVLYAPKIRVRLGKNLNPDAIREGASVYLECTVDANPAARDIRWYFESSEALPSGMHPHGDHLAIPRAQRRHAGRYGCGARNSRGHAMAPPLRLRVQHLPVCGLRGGGVDILGAPGVLLPLQCHAEADPSPSHFTWRGSPLTSWNGSEAVVRVAQEARDVQCYAKNLIGTQILPCVFHIRPLRIPEAPSNCTLEPSGTSAVIRCAAPSTAEGTLRYRALVFLLLNLEGNEASGALVANLSSDVPMFRLPPLTDARYRILVAASNSLGSGPHAELPYVQGDLSSWSVEALRAVAVTAALAVLLAPFLVLLVLRARRGRRREQRGSQVAPVESNPRRGKLRPTSPGDWAHIQDERVLPL
ncbi:nephrin-like [Ornithodoros turicata]|uniref:nephrin-like n=1 Tax=Ornithodoros turicata TaxID=34597 RepID=UPI003138C0F0